MQDKIQVGNLKRVQFVNTHLVLFQKLQSYQLDLVTFVYGCLHFSAIARDL